jgi:3-oxoacyl-[acyl-carrier-protein] synthase-3
MSNVKAAITGIGTHVPDYILTNDELSTMVDTSDEWIMTRIGIKERRILKGEGLGTSDMGVEAVKDLLEQTRTSVDEIELLICCTVTPDMLFPATANIISDKLGIKNAFSFDLNAGCSGFLYGLTTASKFIESGKYKKVVVVGADKMSAIVDYTDRATCPIFGDGAGAVL